LSRCNSKFRIISSKDFPVGAAEESNRQEHSEQAKPRKRSSSTHTTLRVIPLLKLVCDRVLFFPARAWSTINTKTLLLPPQVLRNNAASRLPMETDQRDFL
jgi:hypothetical protein